MSKVDRALHGPGWGEVIFGAVLSLLLGVVLGMLVLVIKPVVVAREVPKEPVPGAVYYIEGSRDASTARQVLAKFNALQQGQSIKVTEQEFNALADAKRSQAKPAAKAGDEPASEGWLVTGTPNVRIHDGTMQVGVPVTINVFGLTQKVIAQARGGIEKEGGGFAYEPDEMYLGSCPIHRVPILSSYVRSKLFSGQTLPADIAGPGTKLSNVSIEGNALVVSM